MLITTTTISSFLVILAKKGLEKAFETGGEKVSEEAYNWIKSLFYKNNEPKKILKKLEEDPGNIEKISNATAIINNSIEDNPEFENYLNELLEKLPKVENNISGSKNVITGNVNTEGGNFINGDNNQLS